MAWAGQTWIEFLQETTYGTFNAAGATFYPRLYQGNSFTPRRTVQRQVIRTADAGNRRIQVVANRQVFTGTLKTLFYPTQAQYVLNMATQLTSNVLNSYSALYWDSIQAWKLLGGRVSALRLSSNAQQDYVSLELDLVFQQRDDTYTTFAQPAESVYPTENPYCHVDSKTHITLAAATVTKYKQIDINLTNILQPTWDEDHIISDALYCGRDFNFSLIPQYTAATYRTDYEQQTPLSWSIGWANPVPHSVTFDGKSSGYIDSVADDLPLDGPGYQTLANQLFFDKAASTDFAVTVV
jgi:hypothetical protein